MTEDEPTRPAWEVSLARLEGKLDAIITSNTALTSSVTDIDRRVRDVEQTVARMGQSLSEIQRHEAPRVSWTGIVAAIAAALSLGFLIAQQLFHAAGG